MRNSRIRLIREREVDCESLSRQSIENLEDFEGDLDGEADSVK